jgi:asparagine synthase (glutamine-hydrolysing)
MDTQLITQRGLVARSGRQSELVTWGLPDWHRDQEALLLAASVRRHDHDLSPAEVRRLVLDDSSALTEVLPAFAAAVSTPSGGARVVTDHLGFRHVFHAHRDGAGIVSTSSRACAVELGAGLDLEAVAVQSSLGWQLDQRTLFDGVRKLAPGEIATLDDGAVTVSSYRRHGDAERMDIGRAVRVAADVLRTYLTAYLEDHPDAGLQLTGGQDSRLLLSAIPKSRRRGLRVVTLGRTGDPDVDIAAGLAARFGMRHELLSLDGLDDMDPAEAYSLCLDAAHRLDFSADPIAHAALTYAEARSEPGPRISGLGGEVSRGFYYLGLPTTAPVSPKRARRLAEWRMFVNESVPVEALDPSFGQWARELATQEVVRILTETGRPWMAATDDLYLDHRMQRWAGVTETAVCLDREVVNPMLDDRFIAIARALAPLDKRNSLFLSRLQLELDAELGSLPLDGRPAPAAYAHRSVRNSTRQTVATLEKARSKVLQRLRRETRPPAGGEILADKVVAHWRENPGALESLHALDVFDSAWLESLLAGDDTPPSSAVALIVNLVAATDDQTMA